MVLVSTTPSGNGLFLSSLRTPLPFSKRFWNLDHQRKHQSCSPLLFGHLLRKWFRDSVLGASPGPSSGTRQVRQSLWLEMHPLTPGVSILHGPQDQDFLSSRIPFYPASASSHPCLAGSSLLTFPTPFTAQGSCLGVVPLPRAAFRVQQRVVGRWTADKGDWGSGGACWRCLFVSPNLSPKLWSLPFIWPDNRPKPCSTPRGEICAPARWQQPTVTLGSAPTDELDRSGKEQPGGEPPGSR